MSLPSKNAVLCYPKRNGQTLFIDYTSSNHRIHKGKYSGPGGKIENGETPEQAAIRELEEETNIFTKKVHYVGKVFFRNKERTIGGKPMTHDWEVHIYECRDFDDSQARTKEGKLAWIDNDKILSLPLHEGDKAIWKNWIGQYSVFEGEIYHKGESLTEARLLGTVRL